MFFTYRTRSHRTTGALVGVYGLVQGAFAAQGAITTGTITGAATIPMPTAAGAVAPVVGVSGGATTPMPTAAGSVVELTQILVTGAATIPMPTAGGTIGLALLPLPPVSSTDPVYPLFDWRANDLRLAARTGHVATFTRAGTGTAIDSAGVTRTLVVNQERYEVLDLDGDGVRETPVLLLGGTANAERLSWAVAVRPAVVGTIYVRFVERGSISTAGAIVLAITADPLTAAYLRLYRATTGYAIEHKVGAVAVASEVTWPLPVVGNVVELRALVTAEGAVQLTQTINDGIEIVGPASLPLTKAATFSGGVLWANSIGTANLGQLGLRAVLIAAGQRSLADVRRLYG